VSSQRKCRIHRSRSTSENSSSIGNINIDANELLAWSTAGTFESDSNITPGTRINSASGGNGAARISTASANTNNYVTAGVDGNADSFSVGIIAQFKDSTTTLAHELDSKRSSKRDVIRRYVDDIRAVET